MAALFVWTGVCWFWVAAAFFLVPRFEPAYQEMKIELPVDKIAAILNKPK